MHVVTSGCKIDVLLKLSLCHLHVRLFNALFSARLASAYTDTF